MRHEITFPGSGSGFSGGVRVENRVAIIGMRRKRQGTEGRAPFLSRGSGTALAGPASLRENALKHPEKRK